MTGMFPDLTLLFLSLFLIQFGIPLIASILIYKYGSNDKSVKIKLFHSMILFIVSFILIFTINRTFETSRVLIFIEIGVFFILLLFYFYKKLSARKN